MKITLAQVLDLIEDLNGNKLKNKKGILNEKISSVLKYKANKLNKELINEEKEFQESRNDLIKKYGEETDKGVEIKLKLEDGSDNPKIFEFNKELIDLINQEIELKDYVFKIKEFTFESESNYESFYGLMITENSES
jgi:hypothetical protein